MEEGSGRDSKSGLFVCSRNLKVGGERRREEEVDEEIDVWNEPPSIMSMKAAVLGSAAPYDVVDDER